MGGDIPLGIGRISRGKPKPGSPLSGNCAVLSTCKTPKEAPRERHKSASYLDVSPKEVTDSQPVLTKEELKCRVI